MTAEREMKRKLRKTALAAESAKTFTEKAWESTENIIAEILSHPFLTGLADGTLPEENFSFYISQDSLYLSEYGRALATLAAHAPDDQAQEFWLNSALECIVTERELHKGYQADTSVPMAPTTLAYTSFLKAEAAQDYAVGVAAVLPCFWIYQYVGDELVKQAAHPNPYSAWLDTYSDPQFAESVEGAKTLANTAYAVASPDCQAGMLQAYQRAARYEYLFWDAAWRLER